MRSRADLILKATGILAIASLGVSAGYAQKLSLPTVTAAPGGTADVTLYLSGVPQASAVNFTIRIDQADRALIDEGTGISYTVASALAANYTYEYNTLNYDDPGTGAVESILEYRGVLYPRTSSVAPFAASTETPIVTLHIPVSSTAGDASDRNINLSIINKFAPDGVTGLIGISDGSGNSVVSAPETPSANGTRNVAKQDGLIQVQAATSSIDFTGSFPNGWKALQIYDTFVQLLPTKDPASTPESEIGLKFTHDAAQGVVVTNSGMTNFGFLESGTNRFSEGFETGKIFASKWTVTTSGLTTGLDLPAIRLGTNAVSFSQISLFQELSPGTGNGGDGITLFPVNGTGTLTTMAAIPPTAVTNSIPAANGMTLEFDQIAQPEANLPGSNGAKIAVSQVEYQVLDPATFTGAVNVFNESYASVDSSAAGYNYLNVTPLMTGTPDVSNFTVAQVLSGGLGVSLAGPGPTNRLQRFAYAFYEKALNTAGSTWQVDGSKVYKVEYTMASDASNAAYCNTGRLRVNVGGTIAPGLFDYVNYVVVESYGPSSDTSYLPTAGGKTYTTWIDIPAELDGRYVSLSFDAYKTTAYAGDPGTPSTIKLVNVMVTAYDRPAFLN